MRTKKLWIIIFYDLQINGRIPYHRLAYVELSASDISWNF